MQQREIKTLRVYTDLVQKNAVSLMQNKDQSERRAQALRTSQKLCDFNIHRML